MTDHHVEVLDLLEEAAPRLPVRSAADAALAISAAQYLLTQVDGDGEEEGELLGDIEWVLARLGAWLRETHGAPPMHAMWTADQQAIVMGEGFAADLRRRAEASARLTGGAA